MSSRTRWIVFLLFAAGFFLSAPVVILYTAGYRYNVATRELRQTGLLFLSTLPKGAEVFLDGERTGSKTPILLKTVIPGTHTILLKKNGYLPWEKELSVESRVTTFAQDVPLFLEADATVALAASVTTSARDALGEHAAYVVDQGTWWEVWSFSSRSGEETLLARVPKEEGPPPNLSWSEAGGFLRVGEDQIVSAANGISFSVTDLVPQAEEGWWDAGRDDRYLVRTKEETLVAINALDLSTEKLSVYASGARSDGTADILAERTGDHITVSRRQGTTSTLIAYIPIGTYTFLPSSAPYLLLEDRERGHVLLLDGTGADQPILLNARATLWQWRPDERALLYTDGYELHLYTPSSHTDETLTRVSDPITGIAWASLGGAVMYSQGSALSVLALDPRNGHVTNVLQKGEGLRDVWVSPDGKDAYFFGIVNGLAGLFRRALS